MRNIFKIMKQTKLNKNKKNNIRNKEVDDANDAIHCFFYKNNICLKDNSKCYLKEMNDEGLYFDCIKKIFE